MDAGIPQKHFGVDDGVPQSLALPTTVPGIIDLFVSAPLAVKVLVAITMGLYLSQLVVPDVESVLAIIATNTYGAHSYVWNVFTAGFFNDNIAMTLAVSLSLIVMGRYLVSSWGSREFISYVVFTNFTVGCGIFVAQIFYYMTSFSYSYLEQPVSGGMGILSALMITIKQRLPDEPIMVAGNQVGSLTAKDLPGILIILSAFLSLVNVLKVFTHCLCGCYFGWVYLRFLQRGLDGLRGDMSTHMAFVSFFPDFLKPYVQILSNAVYKAVCGRTVQTMLDDLPQAGADLGAAMQGGMGTVVDGMYSLPVITAPPLPGSTTLDAERRRARALATLEDRLRVMSLDPEAQDLVKQGMSSKGDAGAGEPQPRKSAEIAAGGAEAV
mmetsp:Transcript_44155/g.107912  ORF Transcript_44155/g.107912 Transcript_44155/m.107912 type:complete len:381 (-) Transcript_44155:179-1321(-)